MSSTARAHIPGSLNTPVDATFFALIAGAFSTALITEADDLMADRDTGDSLEDRELVPVRVPLRSTSSGFGATR
jgi:hypothetical protein